MKSSVGKLLSVSCVFIVGAADAQMAVPGSFAVGPSGAATFALPLSLPSVPGGVKPELSLIYSNQGGNGQGGVGLTFEGLSAISRCSRTADQDGVVGGVNHDLNDRYCLNGRRLIAVKGTDGADATEYSIESSDYSRIISYAESGATNGPGSFVVTTRSGLTMEFGKTADSRIEAQGKSVVSTWALNKVQDAKGNKYFVNYVEQSNKGQYYPSNVSFGCAGASACLYSVALTYAQAAPASVGYVSGSRLESDVRLERISLKQGQQLLSSYAINYSQVGLLAKSKVKSIEVTSGGGAMILPKVSFSWEQGSDSIVWLVNSAPGGMFAPGTKETYQDVAQYEDVNGDGLTDYVVVWNNAGYRNIGVYLSKGDGTYGNLINTAPGGNFGPGKVEPQKDVAGTFIDVNGDGAADYVVPWSNGGSRNIAVYLANKDGTYRAPINNQPGGMFSGMSAEPYRDVGQYADVTGDGLVDYVVPWGYGGPRNLAVYVNKGDGTFANLVNSAVDGYFGAGKAEPLMDVAGKLIDVNGDGAADYVVPWSNGGSRNFCIYLSKKDGTFANSINNLVGGNFSATTAEPYVDAGQFADVNADGLPDYVLVWGHGGPRNIAVYLNKGGGVFSPYVNSVPGGDFGPSRSEPLIDVAGTWVDVNGDGGVDYVVPWSNGGSRNLAVYLSKGDGTIASLINSAVGGNFSASSAEPLKDVGRFADVNGDGLPDYVLPWSNAGTRNIAAYMNKGDGTFTVLQNHPVGGGFGAGKDEPLIEVAGTFIDITGDGADEYVVPWSNAGARNFAVFSMASHELANVNQISTGLGGVTSIVYSPMSTLAGKPYSRTSQSAGLTERHLTTNAPHKVVSRVLNFLGQTSVGSTEYTYGNMVVSTASRRGSRGFEWTQVKDESTGLVSRTYYRQDFPYIGLVDKVGRGTSEANWSNLGLTTYKYTFSAFAATDADYANPVTCVDDATTGRPLKSCTDSAIKPGNRYVPYTHEVLDKSWDWNDQTNVFIALPQTRTKTTQDNWGNATQIKVETLTPEGGLTGYSKTTSTVFAEPDKTNWRIGRVIKSSVTSTAP